MNSLGYLNTICNWLHVRRLNATVLCKWAFSQCVMLPTYLVVFQRMKYNSIVNNIAKHFTRQEAQYSYSQIDNFTYNNYFCM